MGQQSGHIHANLHQSLLPDHRYRLVNVSLWQSYDAFIAATNDEEYAEQLAGDLGHAPSMTVTRGYYRPVASYTQFYGKR